MPWAKVDDGWWCHPKVMGLPLAARGLWVTALSWSCQQRTPVVPATFLAMVEATGNDALALVEAGLWVWAPGGDGWEIVGWSVHGLRRPHIPAWLRRAVYDRDGRRCVTCGVATDLTLDHVQPFSKGGPDTYENFQTMCRPCNSRKGAR